MKPILSSLQNPLIRNIRHLLEKGRERRSQGLFVAEGRREVSLALQGGYEPKHLLVCTEIYQDDPVYPLAHTQWFEQMQEVSSEVYNKLAYRADAEGILLVGHVREHGLTQLQTGQAPLILILEKVEKPGNLGAILRTSDAAGVDAVILCDPVTDIYNPNVIRSSLGCLFTQQIALAGAAEVIAWLRENNIRGFAASPEGAHPYDQQDYTSGTALVFGSESQGISEKFMEGLPHRISIPMEGKIDSLNVSVSAAIITFEAVRQRKNKATNKPI